MKKSINIETGVITFTFNDEEAVELVIGSKKLKKVKENALAHGLSQKIGDSAASFKTEGERRGAVLDMIAQLEGGIWNRKGGGGVTLLLNALIRLYTDKTAEELTKFIDSKTDAEKKALVKNPRVAVVIAEIRAERADGSGDKLLDELGDLS